MKRPAKVKNILHLSALAVKTGQLLYSNHANSRMRERGIIKPEVECILTAGFHEARKDQFNEEFQSWDYSLRGKTVDGRNLRIAIALVDSHILVVTAIDLDTKD